MKFQISSSVLVMFAICALLPAVGSAQTARPSGGSNTQALMQMQQLANEKAKVEAEVSKLKGELEKATKERDSLKRSQETVANRSRGAEAELARAVADRARLEGELAQEKSRTQELVGRLRDTAVSMRDLESQGDVTRRTLAQHETSLSQREQDLKVCVERNSKLITLNEDVLKKFEDQGFWSAVTRREPFTQLKRVELENLADGYRDAARDARVDPPKP